MITRHRLTRIHALIAVICAFVLLLASTQPRIPAEGIQVQPLAVLVEMPAIRVDAAEDGLIDYTYMDNPDLVGSIHGRPLTPGACYDALILIDRLIAAIPRSC